MPSSLRENVSTVIKQNCSKAQNVVFALLIANNRYGPKWSKIILFFCKNLFTLYFRLITLVRMKKYFIHPADLHLIFNLVNSSESFKLSESWTPICLPKFDSRYIKQSYNIFCSKIIFRQINLFLFQWFHACPRILPQ